MENIKLIPFIAIIYLGLPVWGRTDSNAQPTASLPSTLIDDFNDSSLSGSNRVRTNLWGGRWGTLTAGGSMVVTFNGPGYGGSRYSAGVTGTMDGKEWVFDHSQGSESTPIGPWSYTILQCPFYSQDIPVNVSCHGMKGIQFWMKGDGRLYRVELPSAAVKDGDRWCWYGVNFTAPAGTWSFHQIPFSEMTRQKAAPREGLPEHPDGTDVTGIQIYPLESGPFAFSLTRLSLYGSYVPLCDSSTADAQVSHPYLPKGKYKILFYYSSASDEKGFMLGAVHILQDAGNQVTIIDVGSVPHDPKAENWGDYDQVWDARILNYGGYGCAGKPGAADYWGDAWQTKAVDYLNHCGKICLIGECCHFVNRDQGLYGFLKKIRAVKPSFDLCAPSAQGSDETQGQAFYPVMNGLGPTSIYTGWAGGIPLDLLNGTSFVDVKDDWKFNNGVDRSLVCGWTGDQLGGAIEAPFFGRGKLFMVWDTHPWVWPKWVPAGDALSTDIARSSKELTLGMADWLGKGPCPCETQTVIPLPTFTLTPTRIRTPVPSPTPWPTYTPTDTPVPWPWTRRAALPDLSWATRIPEPSPLPTLTYPVPSPTPVRLVPKPRAAQTPTPAILSPRGAFPTPVRLNLLTPTDTPTSPPTHRPKPRPQSFPTPARLNPAQWPSLDPTLNVSFIEPPANIYITFADGPGRYQVVVVDDQGNTLEAVFDRKVAAESDAWVEWDGLNPKGKLVSPGQYFVILFKDGKALKRISVIRNSPSAQ